MNILYIINGLATSFFFIIYKYIDNYTSQKRVPEDLSVKFNNKKIFKEAIVVFLISVSSNYLITEYLYNDYLSTLYNTNLTPNNIKPNIKPPEVFTDKPGF